MTQLKQDIERVLTSRHAYTERHTQPFLSEQAMLAITELCKLAAKEDPNIQIPNLEGNIQLQMAWFTRDFMRQNDNTLSEDTKDRLRVAIRYYCYGVTGEE